MLEIDNTVSLSHVIGQSHSCIGNLYRFFGWLANLKLDIYVFIIEFIWTTNLNKGNQSF
jgi:hypothetical protein